MNEKNILNLVNKFEKSSQEIEKLTNVLVGLEGVLGKLDISMSEVYELTKVDDLTKKSKELVEGINKLKISQEKLNQEYDEIVNLSLYKEGIKDDIKELKNYIFKMDGDLIQIKNEMVNQKKFYEDENRRFKDDLLFSIKAMLTENLENEEAICKDEEADTNEVNLDDKYKLNEIN